MRKSTLLIYFLWVWIVGGGFVQGYLLPTSQFANRWPFPWQLMAVFPLFGAAIAVVGRQGPAAGFLQRQIDRKFGDNACRSFLAALRPELMFACMGFAIGIVGLARTIHHGGPAGAYSVAAFFTSGGIAFLAIYFIRRARRNPRSGK